MTEQMLENMSIGNPPGTYDRILEFSTAVTGSLFFVPTAAFLDDPPSAPGAAVQPPSATDKDAGGANTPPPSPGTDGSLGIAGLRDADS